MPAEYDAKPREIRNFVLLQLGLTILFLLLLFWMFGGLDADLPPIWLWVVLIAAVAVATFFAERVWLTATPLPADSVDAESTGLAIYAGQTVRKLAYGVAPILLGVAFSFYGQTISTEWAAWPILIAGLPGLAVLVFEVWPSARNLSLTETMLDADGASTRLLRNFGH